MNKDGNKTKLPNWFNWEDYERLFTLEDLATWSYLFAQRDPNWSEARARGLTAHISFMPNGFKVKFVRTMWRNGVLSKGMKGHETHKHLVDLVDSFAQKADFFSNEAMNNMVAKEFESQYPIRRSKGDGALCFTNQKDYEAYKAVEMAAFSRTMELAINIQMPKKSILDEIGRLIDEYQDQFRSEFYLELDGRAFRLNGKQKTWTRGIACWDLTKDGYTTYQIAKLLAIDWFNFDKSKDRIGDVSKEVSKLFNKVDPLINGGWKALAGDPTVSIDSDILKSKPTHGG